MSHGHTMLHRVHRDHFDTERQPDDDRNLLLRCQLGGVVAQGAAASEFGRDGGIQMIQSQCFVQQTRKTQKTIHLISFDHLHVCFMFVIFCPWFLRQGHIPQT